MGTNDNSGVECFFKICLTFLPYNGEMKFNSNPPLFCALLPAFAYYLFGLQLWCGFKYLNKEQALFGSLEIKDEKSKMEGFFLPGLALSCAKTEWSLGRKELSITRDAGWCWRLGRAALDTALVHFFSLSFFLFEHLSVEFWYFTILFTPISWFFLNTSCHAASLLPWGATHD